MSKTTSRPKLRLNSQPKIKPLKLPQKKAIKASNVKSGENIEVVNKEVENAKQKSLKKRHEQYIKNLNYFRNKYPKCFTVPPKPLKINIHLDLTENEKNITSKTVIRNFLRKYTKSHQYRNSLVLGAERVGLEGIVDSKIEENLNNI